MFKKFLTEWYLINKTQRRGFLILTVLLILIVSIKLNLDNTPDIDTITLANIQLHNTYSDSLVVSKKDSLFLFNPNEISEKELLQLGLPKKIINNILKYRSKGGVFYNTESVRKIYGMNDSIFNIIQPYILTEKTNKNFILKENKEPSPINNKKTIVKNPVIELNSSDSIELCTAKGIGPSYAKRIIKYRVLLGGFYSVVQLKEVYGISDSTFSFITNHNTFLVDTTFIQKININTANFKTMIKHPYLSKDLVVKILQKQKKREQINTSNIKELISEKELEKIIHYIEY